MIKKARTKIASKVAKLDTIEDFHYAKWLRPPKITAPEVNSLYYSEVLDDLNVEVLKIPHSLKLKFRLPLEPKIPELKHKYLLDKPRALLIFFGLTRPQLFTLKENLLNTPELKDYNSDLPQIPDIIDYKSDLPQIPKIFDLKSELPQLPGIIDQSQKFIGDKAEVFDKTDLYHFDDIKSADQSANFIMNIAAPKCLDIDISIPVIKPFSLDISLPEVTDELANLIPEIYNIELLNVEKFETASVESVSEDLSEISVAQITQIEVPGIENIINTSVTSQYVQFDELPPAEVQFYSPTFDIAHSVFKVKFDSAKTIIKKVVIKQKNLDTVVMDGFNDEQFSESLKNELKTVLSSYRELTWQEYSQSFNALSEYQLQSGELLSQNNFVVLSDELGFEKFDQTSAAAGYLQKKGNIKSVLLISEKNRFNEFWTSSLKLYAKDLKVKKFEPGTTKKVKGNALWFLDVNNLGNIELKDFDKIDLVLFDELINLKSSAAIIDNLIDKIEPAYIWILSAINNPKSLKKFLDDFSFTQKVDFVTAGKSLNEIYEDAPSVITKNIWLELDEMQLFEYSEAMTQAKTELNTLFDSLNPIKFQSSIFTIVHKLKQILNFSSFKNISPKTNLLLEQIDSIKQNKKKVIIFTQYDVNGMKKLEKALEMNNVKFVAGRNGMSTDELKTSMETFYDRREVSVYLTNLKASRLKIKLHKISYIIHFDQWWNPITLWQNDDEIGLNDQLTQPVVVYNYNIKNTFEEEIQKLISEKSFDNKYLFDNLKSEALSEFITPDDWLYVFGLNDQFKKILNSERTKIYTKLQSIDLNTYKGLMKYFFSFLGYRDITVMDIDDEPMFYLIGTSKKGGAPVNLHCKCLLTNNIKKEDYEEVIHFKPGAGEIKRKFVITNGDFAERVVNGTQYIDGKQLANLVLTLGLKSNLIKKR